MQKYTGKHPNWVFPPSLQWIHGQTEFWSQVYEVHFLCCLLWATFSDSCILMNAAIHTHSECHFYLIYFTSSVRKLLHFPIYFQTVHSIWKKFICMKWKHHNAKLSDRYRIKYALVEVYLMGRIVAKWYTFSFRSQGSPTGIHSCPLFHSL